MTCLLSIIPKLPESIVEDWASASKAEGCAVHFAYLSHLCFHVLHKLWKLLALIVLGAGSVSQVWLSVALQ